MRDMNTKPKIQRAFKAACEDIREHIEELRSQQPRTKYDTWVVRMDLLDDPEVRRMNAELGLTSNEGIGQWYGGH